MAQALRATKDAARQARRPSVHNNTSFRAQVTLLSRSYLGWGFDPSYPGWRVFAEERPVVEERRRARAACDLEGNRAGLGCLEHLRNALSFAVVTEWPVGV